MRPSSEQGRDALPTLHMARGETVEGPIEVDRSGGGNPCCDHLQRVHENQVKAARLNKVVSRAEARFSPREPDPFADFEPVKSGIHLPRRFYWYGSHSRSFDHRCRTRPPLTAIANALRCPTKTTSRSPRVTCEDHVTDLASHRCYRLYAQTRPVFGVHLCLYARARSASCRS